MYKRGDQIAYIPDHANGDLAHPDTEMGFVMKYNKNGGGYFCRFWFKYSPGRLRTVANSELVYPRNLIPYKSIDDRTVWETINNILDILDSK